MQFYHQAFPPPPISTSERVKKAMESVHGAGFDSIASLIDASLQCNKLSNDDGRQIALAVLQHEETQKSLVRSKRFCEVISKVANKVVEKEMRALVATLTLSLYLSMAGFIAFRGLAFLALFANPHPLAPLALNRRAPSVAFWPSCRPLLHFLPPVCLTSVCRERY